MHKRPRCGKPRNQTVSFRLGGLGCGLGTPRLCWGTGNPSFPESRCCRKGCEVRDRSYTRKWVGKSMASDFKSATFAWKYIVGSKQRWRALMSSYLVTFAIYRSEWLRCSQWPGSPLAVLKGQTCFIEMGSSIPRRYGDRPSTDC